ncbi:tyrosine-type recombinase/integrase [Parvibaculum sp.]|uniref:tyrosine-type recombinase/integrase n=1 Tax=Parvibaculum sp. TaxID=2024848 RepID=UPI001D73EB0D|nr:tyrosine-type recombinase/integrase [Parvibaculum sp.]MBX3488536.1 tyrosine-type recombinase/integrase [Parvibaculum sp.]
MRSIRVRYLESRKIAGGRTGYYYNPKADLRAAGIVDRQPLGEDLAEAIAKAERLNAIVDEYRAAVRRGEELKVDRKEPGSIAHLFDEYQKSDSFNDTSKKTQVDYKKCLRTLENTVLKNGVRFGDMPAAKLEYRHADALYKLLRERHGLSYANAMMRVARRVFGLGIRWKLTKQNPFSKPGLKSTESRDVVWTVAQMHEFMDAARKEGYPSLALVMLMAYELAQRVVDVRLFTWDIYKDGVFSIRQTKTNTFLRVPASDELVLALEDLERKNGTPIAVCEATGRAWGASFLTHTFRDIMRTSGLPENLRISDMRRTSLTELGDAGATEDELISMSGHLTREMVRIYSRATVQKARNAITKREAWRQKVQTNTTDEVQMTSPTST